MKRKLAVLLTVVFMAGAADIGNAGVFAAETDVSVETEDVEIFADGIDAEAGAVILDQAPADEMTSGQTTSADIPEEEIDDTVSGQIITEPVEIDVWDEEQTEEAFDSGSIDEAVFDSGEEDVVFESGDDTEELLASGEERTDRTVTASAGCTTGELQTLLNLNCEGNYHLTVEIPAGTYQLTSPLFVYSYTTIKADANARLVKQARYGAMIEAKLLNDKGGYDGCSNITIDGGIWDTEPIMYAAGGTESFRFIHCNHITIKNLTLCNVPDGSHLLVFAGVSDSAVTNCKFYGYGDNSVNLRGKEAIQLDVTHNKQVVPTVQNVTWDDLPCKGITITGCEFYNFSRGIGSHTAVPGRYHTDITISGNSFHDLSDSAVRLYNYTDTVVKNNTMTNTAVGVLAYSYNSSAGAWMQPNDGNSGKTLSSYHITISGNKITDTKAYHGWGDGIRLFGSAQYPLKGVTVSGNTISGSDRYGIYVSNVQSCVIKKNLISKYGRTIQKNIAGIMVYYSGIQGQFVKVARNTIDGSDSKGAMDGVRLSNSNYAIVTGNTIMNVSNCGVYVYQSSNCKIGYGPKNYNTIKAPASRGIYFTTGSNSGSVLYNKISSAGAEGIAAYQSTKMKIKGNSITSANTGIYVKEGSSGSLVRKNVISSAGLHGIRVYKAANTTVAYNTIKKYGVKASVGYGIYISASGGSASAREKIVYNTIVGYGANQKRDGIHVISSLYMSVSRNTIKMAKSSGNSIFLSGSKKSLVRRNQITTTKTVNGIYVTGCRSTRITYNTFSGADKAKAVVVAESAKCTNAKNVIK